jgi:hypothetical protein
LTDSLFLGASACTVHVHEVLVDIPTDEAIAVLTWMRFVEIKPRRKRT